MTNKIIKYLNYNNKKFSFLRRYTKDKKFIFFYIYTEISKFFLKKKRFNIINSAIGDLKNNYKLEESFFGYERKYNIMFSYEIFLKKNFFDKNINILEIGTYEGGCAIYFLKYLKKSSLQVVDTWSGEFSKGTLDKNINFNTVENNFDYNTVNFKSRIKKYKGSSQDFFNQRKKDDENFDLIFVDGSHHYNDVINDANESWLVLKKGGIMIFDDFLWDAFAENSPIRAINEFYQKNKNEIKLHFIYHQLIIEKK